MKLKNGDAIPGVSSFKNEGGTLGSAAKSAGGSGGGGKRARADPAATALSRMLAHGGAQKRSKTGSPTGGEGEGDDLPAYSGEPTPVSLRRPEPLTVRARHQLRVPFRAVPLRFESGLRSLKVVPWGVFHAD